MAITMIMIGPAQMISTNSKWTINAVYCWERASSRFVKRISGIATYAFVNLLKEKKIDTRVLFS